MRIDTTDFGPQDINPETIIDFPKGMPGFEDNIRFKLFNEENAKQVFHLQSVTDPTVAFSVVDPAGLNVFYEITLSDEELALLETEDPDEIGILVFTYRNSSVNDDQKQTPGLSFSFINPLILNLEGKKGLMKALSNSSQQITIKAE